MNEIHKRYVASIPSPPAEIYQGWRPCMDWCEQNINNWWYIGEGVFEFIDKQDHLMFVLRWS
jgi:hypothetical protein